MNVRAAAAGAADALLAACFVLLVLSLLSSGGRPFPLLVSLAAVAVSFGAAAVYRIALAGRTRWVSPGEAICGYRSDWETKTWAPAYRRGGSLVLALQLVCLGWFLALWMSRYSDTSHPYGRIIFAALVSAVVFRGLWYWGRGDRIGGVMVGGYFLFVSLGLHAWRFVDGLFFPRMNAVIPLGAPGITSVAAPVLAVACLVAVVTSRRRPEAA